MTAFLRKCLLAAEIFGLLAIEPDVSNKPHAHVAQKTREKRAARVVSTFAGSRSAVSR
jgi:hypothetical protein